MSSGRAVPPRADDGSRDRPHATARHIGLVGALGPHKGSAFLLACAQRAATRGLQIHFTLIGFTDRDAAFQACSNVTIEGAYVEAELAGRMAALAPDLIWFSALWPETYSYTLSAAFEAAIMPVAFDFGAIAERIRATGYGHLLPVALMFDVDLTLDALLAIDPGLHLAPPAEDPVTYGAPLQSYYGLASERVFAAEAEA